MLKVAVAVIKNEDKILLMRRRPNQKFPGYWELPGGQSENGERISATLKRKLSEKFGSTATVGKLITSATFGNYEVFAYDVAYNEELAKIAKSGDIEWVNLNEAAKYDLLPSDLKIIMHISKTKETTEPQQKESAWLEYIRYRLTRPTFNTEEDCWVVYLNEPQKQPQMHKFANEKTAIDFYVKKANQILKPLFEARPIIR